MALLICSPCMRVSSPRSERFWRRACLLCYLSLHTLHVYTEHKPREQSRRVKSARLEDLGVDNERKRLPRAIQSAQSVVHPHAIVSCEPKQHPRGALLVLASQPIVHKGARERQRLLKSFCGTSTLQLGRRLGSTTLRNQERENTRLRSFLQFPPLPQLNICLQLRIEVALAAP